MNTSPLTGHLLRTLGLAALLVPISGTGSEQGNTPYPEGYRYWTHVKSMVIYDKGHPLYGFHNVYANPTALPTVKSGGVYGEGSMFVVSFYEAAHGDGSYSQGAPLQIVVMKKDRGFADTGGWAYEAFKAGDKTPLIGAQAAEKCHACHTAVADDDYVFSHYIP